MSRHTLLLRHALLTAISLPLGGCGGSTSPSTGTTSPAGPGGSDTGGQGGSGAGAQGGSGAGAQGGGGAAGPGGSAPGGQSGAAGQGGAGPTYLPCKDPTPYVVQGVDTGYVLCAQGTVHRASVVTCPSALPRANACVAGAGSKPECAKDADCTKGINGHCDPQGFGGPLGCVCSYGCTTDADCAPAELCLCGPLVGTCVPKDKCTVDADCGAGLCLEYNAGCLQGASPAFACQTTADTCVGDKECSSTGFGQICQIPQAGPARSCEGACVAGRPLLVGRELRLAPLVASARWA